ncbi:MAG: phosphotransferase [Dehalococcoidia bacterium]|nr:phosphotransferase [Dehalococcoidia bacterium]
MTAPSIPHTSEDITADWLTDALRSSGVITTSSVTSIDAGDTSAGHGFTGRIARLAVTYDAHEKYAPASIIAKFPSYDPTIRAAVTDSAMSYEREIRCYENLLGNVALSTPRRYYSACDPESGECILLLQDLAPARFGDNVGNPSREDIESAIRAIAGFHAEFWESPRLVDMDWLPEYAQDADARQRAFRQAIGPFLSTWGKYLRPSTIDLINRLGDSLARIRLQLSRPPRTILHGDYRLDNLAFDESGRGPAVIDWQAPSIGRSVADMAYFIVYCIDPNERRALESELLKLYHSVLVEYGVGAYDFESCMEDYRLSIAANMLRTVRVGGTFDYSGDRAQALLRTILHRVETALSDHRVAELI